MNLRKATTRKEYDLLSYVSVGVRGGFCHFLTVKIRRTGVDGSKHEEAYRPLVIDGGDKQKREEFAEFDGCEQVRRR